MLDTIVTIGIFLLGLSILIVIHELGHYWAARLFGIRVEAFALFWGKKLVSFKRGDTEWQINMIPIGGYVKISGMLDESLDEEQVKGDPEPWEFRSKPIWQRLIVMMGGVIMNVVLGLILFIGLKYFYGDNKILNSNLEYGIFALEGSPSYDLGFRTGDKLLTYKGEEIEFFTDAGDLNKLVDSDKYYEVDRAGTKVKVEIPDDYMNTYMDYPEEVKGRSLFAPDMKPIVYVLDTATNTARKEEELSPVNINAWKGGLRKFDLIVAVDSTPMSTWSEFLLFMKKKPEQEFEISVLRAGKNMSFAIQTDTNSTIGVLQYTDTLKTHIEYTFSEAIPEGTSAAFGVVVQNVKGLKALFTGNANPRKSLSGPVKIAQIYGQGFKIGGWQIFWKLTAMLSMILAVMNLLPIPVLDGGQILILTIEGISGREIPPKPKMWILQISFYIVIGLMLLVVANDIFG